MDQHPNIKRGLCALVLLSTFSLGGCETLSYYWQAANGQLELKRDQQEVSTLIEDPETDPALKQQLSRAQEILAFAYNELHLPNGESYQTYVDTGRPYVVWNLFVADEFSTQAYQWCYPIVGCLNYRGYFDRENAETVRKSYQQKGFDTWIGGVRAYSTLGWFKDPLLNTFINDSELQLAELIFHELSHQLVFAEGDTDFNESLATVIAHHGTQLWAEQHSISYDPAHTRRQLQRRSEFASLVNRYRNKLAGLYKTKEDPAEMRLKKGRILDNLRLEYAEKRRGEWLNFDLFDQWIAGTLNNAKLNTVASYYRWVEPLNSMLQHANYNLPVFYQKLEQLADLKPDQRLQALEKL